jgi:hypothetical protein
MSFLTFKEAHLQATLNLLWDQWSVLGVGIVTRRLNGECVDPEALIMATCDFGRFDQRLFDGMLEWLARYEELISSQRLSSLAKRTFPESKDVLRSVAAFLYARENKHRWRKLGAGAEQPADAVPLFVHQPSSFAPAKDDLDATFLSSGFSRARFDKKAQVTAFQFAHPASLWLRLRALTGVSSRTDVLTYLLTHREGGHPSEIARVLEYAQRAVQQALTSMNDSGWVVRSERRREVSYTVSELLRTAFVSSLEGAPEWLTWTRYYHAAAEVWKTLSDPRLVRASAEAQSAELRDAMLRCAPDLSRLGFSGYFVESQSKTASEHIEALSKGWTEVFQSLYEQ